MPARKPPTKTSSKSVIEELAIGYFKIEGELSLTKRVMEGRRYSKPRAARVTSNGKKVSRLRAVERHTAARVSIHEPFSFWSNKFNIPIELAEKMKIGGTYEIQCTIIERKGEE